jgi:UDP-3-O-[3-hydroxymyristoyl] N-acetylglucosamine deacetylase
MEFQHTLRREVRLTGIGLHSGEDVNIVIKPAKSCTGVIFKRVDLTPVVQIPAKVDMVLDTSLATVIGIGDVTISTVEHCMAALYALGVDNAIVEVDGPEVPVLDGSAEPYVLAVNKVGLKKLRAPRKILKVLKPIRVQDGDKFSILRPSEGFSITYSIDFEDGFPGEQHFFLEIKPDTFASQLCRARTFGFLRDVEMLRSIGKARGASMDNAIALEDGKVLNPEGLRMPDEMVRHKMLDAVGDLALSGVAIRGHLVVHKGGHELHRKLVSVLLSRPDAWTLEDRKAPAKRKAVEMSAPAGMMMAHA